MAPWVLVQIQLSEGFKIVDLTKDGNASPLDPRVQEALNRFGCAVTALNAFLGFFGQSNVKSQYPTCAAMIRRVLKDELKIDAFLYSYNSIEFSECNLTDSSGQPRENRAVAWVITSSENLSTKDVEVFNSQTTALPGDRLVLQSLFYKADHDNFGATTISTLISNSQLPTSFVYEGLNSLLWADLDGKPTSIPDGWIKNNLYGCGDQTDY